VTTADFDIDAFLAQPLTARVATNGPTVRPTWYLWEDQAFWILTGPWAKLLDRVRADPALALTVEVPPVARSACYLAGAGSGPGFPVTG